MITRRWHWIKFTSPDQRRVDELCAQRNLPHRVAPRRLLALASFACALALVVHGCAGGNSSTNAFTGTDSGPGDGTASSSSGGSSGSSSGLTGSSSGSGSGSSSGGASDASQDSPGLADAMSCVHNDDCTGSNICTSGYACLGGLCVPTGKPQNCDDGVPCTDDSCSAQQNKCVHTPNDSNCPNSEYCDPVKNCVQTLPCTPGSSVCDRLNTDVCNGLYSCDATKMYCVLGAPPCAMVTNATTMCTDGTAADGGAQATCAWTCNSGYVHIVWNNGVPTQVTSFGPPPPSGGCECHQTSTTDKPDLGFVDSNCDGIDGTVTNAIFVDTVTGADTNPGTMASPMKTIGAAITAASTASPAKDVYVSKGLYAETITMASGVSIYGGYDAANQWQRANANVTTIASPNATGVLANGLGAAQDIQLFTVTANDAQGQTATGDGKSSIGILVVDSSAGVTIAGCNVAAGAGAKGADGSPGGTGTQGGKGGDGSGQGNGGAGTGCGGANGGPGGAGEVPARTPGAMAIRGRASREAARALPAVAPEAPARARRRARATAAPADPR